MTSLIDEVTEDITRNHGYNDALGARKAAVDAIDRIERRVLSDDILFTAAKHFNGGKTVEPFEIEQAKAALTAAMQKVRGDGDC